MATVAVEDVCQRSSRLMFVLLGQQICRNLERIRSVKVQLNPPSEQMFDYQSRIFLDDLSRRIIVDLQEFFHLHSMIQCLTLLLPYSVPKAKDIEILLIHPRQTN